MQGGEPGLQAARLGGKDAYECQLHAHILRAGFGAGPRDSTPATGGGQTLKMGLGSQCSQMNQSMATSSCMEGCRRTRLSDVSVAETPENSMGDVKLSTRVSRGIGQSNDGGPTIAWKAAFQHA